jgi:hypothetical protein
MDVICLAIPLSEGTWVRVSQASRRLMAIDPSELPSTIRICYGGDRQLDWVGIELAARAETQRIFYTTRPGPGTVRRRFTVLRNIYEFALGLGLLVSAQGMAIPALAGIWMLAKAGLRTRREFPKLGRPGNMAASPMIRSAHSGLARLGELFDDEIDERSAYLGASSLARSLALPEAEDLYEQLLAEPTGLHPGQVDGVWLAPAAGLDRPLLAGGPEGEAEAADTEIEVIDAGVEALDDDRDRSPDDG